LIVGPAYQGRLPVGFKGTEIIRAASDYVFVDVRIALVNDTDADLAAVNDIMDRMTIVSLPDWEAKGSKPLPSKDQKPVRAAYATFPRMAEITDLNAKMTAMDLMQLVSLALNDPSMTKRTDSIKEVETLVHPVCHRFHRRGCPFPGARHGRLHPGEYLCLHVARDVLRFRLRIRRAAIARVV